jgi:CDGSH-type Zn-finger protein/truncated hemoglobin YjbI/ferredoxin
MGEESTMTTAVQQAISAEDLDDVLRTVRSMRQKAIAKTSTPAGAGVGNLANRLQASVIRPLAMLLGETAEPPPSESHGIQVGSPDMGLWDLTRRMTALCAATGRPAALIEAAAALQDLACQFGAAEVGDRIAKLRAILDQQPPSIRIEAKGPLLVTNVEDIHDWLGRPLPARPLTALCRCGASAMKPYCDGSHARGFDDAKDPARLADRRDTYVGQQVTIFDNRGTCQHSGFCTERLSTVFRVDKEPFAAPSGGRMDEIMRAVRDCPSGALSYAIDGIEARADVDFHGTRAPSIEVSKDGPYRVTGTIALLDADADSVVRNAGASTEHYTLCRCGHAQNKPFCTGMHWSIKFRDPIMAQDHEPTMFEWAGGLPALTRMMRLFYEKFVPADDILAPVFANMAADHPQRVAKWLGEVFCGPKCYSEEYGGYPRMISEHVGKCLTEEMRARWVKLLIQSAQEAGLPNDAEFRSAFHSYIEWGSRLAVENSQTQSKPPLSMPMPHWDWNTAAGPPGGRVSALATADKPNDAAPILPGANENVEFGKHIKPLFRERDRKSMKFAFDLASHADVSTHADAILERVRNGTMPCDGAWPKELVEVFARWVEAGKPE